MDEPGFRDWLAPFAARLHCQLRLDVDLIPGSVIVIAPEHTRAVRLQALIRESGGVPEGFPRVLIETRQDPPPWARGGDIDDWGAMGGYLIASRRRRR